MNARTRKAMAALGTALTTAVVLVALGGTAANASDQPPSTPDTSTTDTGSTANLSSDQVELLESGQLKRVSIDPATRGFDIALSVLPMFLPLKRLSIQ